MIKPKYIISAGAAGFVLSFLISIISTHSFGHSILRAFIFGLVFAALEAGISFLNGKFLGGGEDSGITLGEGVPLKEQNTLGSKVDITLSDDNLTDDGDKLNFTVSANRQTMSPEEAKAPVKSNVIEDAGPSMDKVPAASRSMAVPSEEKEAAEEASVFQPVALGSADLSGQGSGSDSPVIKASSQKEGAAQEGPASRRAQAKAEREADIREVGALPDIGSFEPEMKGDSDEGLIVDSDFASDGVDEGVAFSSPSPASAAAVDPKEHDANTMAKAIRTLLKKED